MPSPFTSNNVFFCSTRSVNGGIAENPGKKQRVATLARARDITVHSFMVAAIENLLVVEETRAAFLAEAEKRAAQFRKTGRPSLLMRYLISCASVWKANQR
ncbi:MAG: hypothetical protein ABL891_06795 [Burkholderiales bacterium]